MVRRGERQRINCAALKTGYFLGIRCRLQITSLNMLKSSYLGRSDRPRIILITGGEDATSTVQNYRRYFGRDAIKNEDIFTDGLEVKGLSRLKTTGILQ